MSKPKTYVTIILDQSQSMCGTKAQAVQGYNEHVQQMKINSKEQDIFCSLITFNGDVFEHLWMEPADKLTEASAEDYKTEGSTALRDAVGYAIEKLKKTVTDPEASHLVIIVSDGEENASRHYSNSSLNELKDSVDKTGKWTFTYMGCDDKYLQKIARDMKIPLSNMAKWSNNTPELAMRGMKRTADKVGAYYSARSKGVVASDNVYSDVECCLADFTVDDGTPAVPSTPTVIPDMLSSVNITMNVLNDAHQAMNVKNDGHEASCYVSPFNNYKPVSWKG
jgi:uncharacterized protein YegL